MNDPHVVALIYKVRHKESVDYGYGEAEPLAFENADFRVEVKDGEARFEIQQHYATEKEAREAVEPFIRNWEFDACFGHRHEHFHLDFARPEIIDQNPAKTAKGVVSASVHLRGGLTGTLRVTATVGHDRYPPPPTKIDTSHPDVQTLYERYKRHREKPEELPGFAYFCLTVLESQFATPQRNRKPTRKRREAADHYGVDVDVLQRIGELSSTKGGSGARKREGVDTPLTDDEHRFLERATVRLIRRIAERHAADGDLPQISMKDASQ